MDRDVHSLILSIQHFLCRQRRRPPSKVPWRKFWRGCCGVWHSRTMQISASWQLPEEVPVDPQVSVILLNTQVGDADKFPQVLGFESIDHFLQSQQAGSIFHGHRGWWRWQETRGVWNSMRSWWCCTASSCLGWSLRQFWCRILLNSVILAQSCSQSLETGHLL